LPYHEAELEALKQERRAHVVLLRAILGEVAPLEDMSTETMERRYVLWQGELARLSHQKPDNDRGGEEGDGVRPGLARHALPRRSLSARACGLDKRSPHL
jgi:hypothetical protein